MPVNGLLKLLGISEKNAVVRDPESIARISEVLDGLGERGRFIASYAYVLARVAHADSEISEAEVETMRERVEAFGGLPDRQAELAVKIATGRLMELAASENYIATRVFRDLSSREERLKLLECLFAVAAADENVSTDENREISQIANELGLTNTEVAAVRGRYREQLAVLKNLPSQ